MWGRYAIFVAEMEAVELRQKDLLENPAERDNAREED